MHILFLSSWFPYPPDNGSKIRVYYLLQALVQRHNVTLLSFAFDTAQPHANNDLHQWCQEVQMIPVNPFMINRAGILETFFSLRPVSSRPIIEMSQMINHVRQTNRFDAVIASTEMMADYALQLPVTTAKILESHNSMARWMSERYKQATGITNRFRCWLSWQKRRFYEMRFLPQFDQVIMVSEQDRQVAQKALPSSLNPVATIPNGVDCQYNQPHLAKSKPAQLVFNGALTYQANYEAMLYFLNEIYPQIKMETPDVSLTITGTTDGVDLTPLPLDGTIQLTGWVKDVRIPVASATLCIVPLLQGGGTRLKILEAMALGTPVVATSKGAEGLEVVDGQHLLLADDPISFARKVVELLHQPDQRRYLAAQARNLVETRYDWQQIGQQFVHLVEGVVAKKREQA